MNEMMLWFILMAGAYLLGAIPFGYLIGKMRGVDIREHGSKNIGATNAGRVLGRKWGVICFVLDVGKGFAPTLTAGVLMNLADLELWQEVDPTLPSAGEQFLWVGVGFAAILGHMFPIYLSLRGGKGVATAFGVMLGVFPFLTWPVLGGVMVWLAVVRLGRMVSLASICAALSLPVWLVVGRIPFDIDTNADASFVGAVVEVWPLLVVTVLLALLIVLRHRSNIGRILAGTESKIPRKKEPGKQAG